MAMVKYKTGRRQIIPDQIATSIWLVLHGYQQPDDDKQLQFVGTVEEVSLAWRTAPDEYIKENFEAIATSIVNTWRVDQDGKPSRPEYGPELRFAEKWGLWARGKPTKLAEDAIASLNRPRKPRQLHFVR